MIPKPEQFQSEYAFIYLPALAFAYLYSATDPGTWFVFGIEIPQQSFYLYSVLLTVIGAILWHRIFILIFGRDGPDENPKKRYYSLLMFFELVSGYKAYDEFANKRSTLGNLIRAVQSIPLRNYVMFLTLSIPLFFTYLSMYLGVILLYFHLSSITDPDIIGALLFVSMLIVSLQTRLWKWFPDYVNPDKVENAELPEYKRYELHG